MEVIKMSIHHPLSNTALLQMRGEDTQKKEYKTGERAIALGHSFTRVA